MLHGISVYCIWIIIDPTQSLLWFIMMRAFPTIFWFCGKTALIWLYNGRLHYNYYRPQIDPSSSSSSSSLSWSYRKFLTINLMMTIWCPVSLIIGYSGVYGGDHFLISLDFESFNFLYIFLTFYLLMITS